MSGRADRARSTTGGTCRRRTRNDSRMRFDELTGEWVAFATHRMDRTYLPPADLCPLCPTRPGRAPTEIPSDDYDVVVFENRFPSFAGRPRRVPDAPGRDGEPLVATLDVPAAGRCEVVCFTSDHDASLPPARRASGCAPSSRRGPTAPPSCRRLPGVEQVFVFENRGREIGVTLHHPHGQIYAYPFVAPRTAAMLRQAARHRARTGRRPARATCSPRELRPARGSSSSGDHWTAYVPVAARWPVEIHLVPHRDRPDLAGPRRRRARRAGDRPTPTCCAASTLFYPRSRRSRTSPAWHQAPVGEGRELCRLHLDVFSIMRAPRKLKYLAGSESAMRRLGQRHHPRTHRRPPAGAGAVTARVVRGVRVRRRRSSECAATFRRLVRRPTGWGVGRAGPGQPHR